MRLITLECPKCNAKLEANPTLTQAVCNCCGFQFLLDDESRQVNIRMEDPRHVGYEMEWGKSAQRVDEGHITADKVRGLMKPISDLNRLISDRNALSLQIEALKKKVSSNSVKPFIISFCIFLFALLCGGGSTGALVAGVVAAVISYIICLWYQGYSRAETIKQIELKTKQYHDINNNISYINTVYDVGFIPFDYRTDAAMNFLYNMLVNQRAVNLQQAINLYEEEKRRAEMAAFYQAQLNLQAQQLQAVEAQKQAVEAQNRQMAAQIQQSTIQSQQLQRIEANMTKQESDDSILGKLFVAGGIVLTTIALSKKDGKK